MPIRKHNWSAVYASGEANSLLDDMLEVPTTREVLRKEYYYQKVLSLCEERGFTCLSKEYVSSQDHLKFKCSVGHSLKVQSNYFFQDDYECTKCKKNKRKKEKLKRVRAKAKEFGWKCISTYYTKRPMKFQCSCGNVVKVTHQSLYYKRTRFCVKCRGEHQRKEYFKRLKAVIKEKGGKCIGEYKTSHKPMRFQCSEGHQFNLIPTSIVHEGRWCPKCREKEANKEKMVRAAKAAAENGGLCFSRDFEDGNLMWKCRNGHVFERPYGHIIRGLWCPECGEERRKKLRAKEMEIGVKRKAALHDVVLVGELAVGHESKNEWICSNGHKFLASYKDMRYKEIWCPLCSIKHKLGEQDSIEKNEDNLPAYEKGMHGNRKRWLKEDYVTKVRGISVTPTTVFLQLASKSNHSCGCCERPMLKGEIYIPPFQMSKLTGEKYDFDSRVCFHCFELG